MPNMSCDVQMAAHGGALRSHQRMLDLDEDEENLTSAGMAQLSRVATMGSTSRMQLPRSGSSITVRLQSRRRIPSRCRCCDALLLFLGTATTLALVYTFLPDSLPVSLQTRLDILFGDTSSFSSPSPPPLASQPKGAFPNLAPPAPPETILPELLSLPPPSPSPPPPMWPPRPPPPRPVVDVLNERFRNGRAHTNNDPNKLGVLLHQFDGMEDYEQGWKPCTPRSVNEWCAPFADRFASSIINRRQPLLFNDKGGIIFRTETPELYRVLCSYAADAGSMSVVCDPPGVSATCVPGCWSGEPSWCTQARPWQCAWQPAELGIMMQKMEESNSREEPRYNEGMRACVRVCSQARKGNAVQPR